MTSRGLTDYERMVVSRLLEADFPGCEELRLQSLGLSVRQEWNSASRKEIGFDVASPQMAEVVSWAPVTGLAPDDDGDPIECPAGRLGL